MNSYFENRLTAWESSSSYVLFILDKAGEQVPVAELEMKSKAREIEMFQRSLVSGDEVHQLSKFDDEGSFLEFESEGVGIRGKFKYRAFRRRNRAYYRNLIDGVEQHGSLRIGEKCYENYSLMRLIPFILGQHQVLDIESLQLVTIEKIEIRVRNCGIVELQQSEDGIPCYRFTLSTRLSSKPHQVAYYDCENLSLVRFINGSSVLMRK